MTLKPLRIVAVGRLKTPFWKAAAEHYVERLVRWRAFSESIIKDGDPSLPIVDRNALEGKGILSALSASDIPVVLDERGKTFTSRQFSVFLERLSENASRRPCFIIGGAFGLDDSVKQAASHLIALGPLTMTHELARVVLFEQLYRAESLTRGLPYHHGWSGGGNEDWRGEGKLSPESFPSPLQTSPVLFKDFRKWGG